MKLREVNKEMGNMVRKVCTAKSTASTGDTESLEIIEKGISDFHVFYL
jgi:hypothetical protein